MQEQDTEAKAPWITYRPQLKVLDCTVRDGGLINDHQFSDEFVRAVYDTCLAAGVDTMRSDTRTPNVCFREISSETGGIAAKRTCGASLATTTPPAPD